MRRVLFTVASVIFLGVSVLDELRAQQVTVSTPMHVLGDRFAEQAGVQWGVNFRNGFARFGGPFFNGQLGHTYHQNFISQTPSLTLTPGVPGVLVDQTVTPFVVGFLPVVGGYAVVPGIAPGATIFPPSLAPVRPGYAFVNPEPLLPPAVPFLLDKLQRARMDQFARGGDLSHEEIAVGEPPRAEAGVANSAAPQAAADTSSAARAAPSVAEARSLRAAEEAEQQEEAQKLWEQGLSAEAAGKFGAAKVFYSMASRRATGELRRQIVARLESLKPPTKQIGTRREF